MTIRGRDNISRHCDFESKCVSFFHKLVFEQIHLQTANSFRPLELDSCCSFFLIVKWLSSETFFGLLDLQHISNEFVDPAFTRHGLSLCSGGSFSLCKRSRSKVEKKWSKTRTKFEKKTNFYATDQIKSRNFASARKASVKLILTVGIFLRSKQNFSARTQLIHRESADRANQLSVALLLLEKTRLKARG